MTAKDIEVKIAKYFDWRRNIIVPNASWGVGLHECDMLILSERNFATEVEIKISRSDLKADQKKEHGHNSVKIKNLWFAVPAELVPSALELCPARAGIFALRDAPRGMGRFRFASVSDLFFENHREEWFELSYEERRAFYGGERSAIHGEMFIVRKPQPEPGARAWTMAERLKLAEIGVMRYWGRRT